MWLVATGAEERPYTGTRDHLGASALVRRLGRTGRLDGRAACALFDEVGRGSRFDLHSTATKPARGGRTADHRRRFRTGCAGCAIPPARKTPTTAELARAGAPAAKLGVVDEPLPAHGVRHARPAASARAFTRVLTHRLAAPANLD